MNRERFKLFTLRDQLAILAMKGIVSDDDKKYIFLMKNLNATIEILDDFSIVTYLKHLSLFMDDKKAQNEIKGIVRSLRKHKNEDMARIACSYFEITHSIFENHTRILRTTIAPIINYTLIPILKTIVFALRLLINENKSYSVVGTIQNKTDLVFRIDHDLENTIDQFKGALPCT